MQFSTFQRDANSDIFAFQMFCQLHGCYAAVEWIKSASNQNYQLSTAKVAAEFQADKGSGCSKAVATPEV